MEVFNSQEQISFLIAAKVNDTLRYHLDSDRVDVLQNVTKLELRLNMGQISPIVFYIILR